MMDYIFVQTVCEGIQGQWISREEPFYLMEGSLPPRVRGACGTDDQGSETAEVTIWWLGCHLSGAEVSHGNSRSGSHGNSQSGEGVIKGVDGRLCAWGVLAAQSSPSNPNDWKLRKR